VHDGARTRRALLALEAERRGHDAFCRIVEIAVIIHDDGVLAAHLEHGALDPQLAIAALGRLEVDVQPDFLRARESNEARLRCVTMYSPTSRPPPGTKVHNARRKAALLEHLR
jgi:hypothetical protein